MHTAAQCLASPAVDTREQILTAAIDVYAQHGFRGATTRRIADAAGVNEVTVFRHFGSKDALLAEAIRHSAAQHASSVLPAEPRDPQAELTLWAESQIGHLRDRRSVIRKCMGELEERAELMSCAAIGPRAAFGELAGYLRALHSTGLVSREFDVNAAAALLLGALFADATSRELASEIFPPQREAARSYVTLLLRGLGFEQPASVAATATAAAPPSLPDATGA